MTLRGGAAVLLAALAAGVLSCNDPLTEAVPAAAGASGRTVRRAARPASTEPAPRPAVRRLLPVDEAASDPSFQEFRESLLAAVRARDDAALIRHVAPDVFLSFGGPEQGAGAFRTEWKLWMETSPAWRELETILTHGGAFREIGPGRRQFCAPYVYAVFPDDLQRIDLAVLTPDAPLRAEPRDDAAVIRNLEYEIVSPSLFQPPELNADDGSVAEWLKVETTDGVTGYVREWNVRSPRQFRACFEMRDGAWQLTAFMSGD